jgi:hypothetical protein
VGWLVCNSSVGFPDVDFRCILPTADRRLTTTGPSVKWKMQYRLNGLPFAVKRSQDHHHQRAPRHVYL